MPAANEPAAKKPRVEATAPAPAAPISKAAALDIPETLPFRPQLPSEAEVAAGAAPSLKTYISHLYKSVVSRLSLFLYDCNSVALRAPLYKQKCPQISSASGDANLERPTSFREAWDMQHCVESLSQNGIYEAAAPLWQFDPLLEHWGDTEIFPHDASWSQFLACLSYWSEANFVSSASAEGQRRYIFPGFIPTAVKSVAIVQATGAKTGNFTGMPLCGAHVLAWSLYGAIDGALNDGADERVLRLCEASLSITVRMRAGPSAVQLTLDNLTFVDTLRLQNVASGSHSFFEFVSTVSSLPGFNVKSSGPAIVDAAKRLGVAFNAKPIERNMAYSILAVMSFTPSSSAKAAWRFAERVSPRILVDPTRCLRLCQTIKKSSTPDELDGVFVFVMEPLAVSLICGDVKEEELSIEWLVGSKTEMGFCQTYITKRKFIMFFVEEQLEDAARGAGAMLGADAVVKMRSTFISPKVFFEAFAKTHMPSNAGDADDDSILKRAGEKAEAYIQAEFRTDAEKHAAGMLSKIMMGQFDDEFHTLAAQAIPFATHFGSGLDGDRSGLQEAFDAYKKCLLEAPVSIKPTSEGDTRGAYAAIPGDAESEYKAKLHAKVIARRQELIVFHTADWKADPYKKGGKLDAIFQISKFNAKRGEAGKQHGLLLMSADLFPLEKMFASSAPHKATAEFDESMAKAFRWMVAAHGADRLALAMDGRCKQIRRKFEDLVDELQKDKEKHLQGCIVYAEPCRGDVRFHKRRVFGNFANLETFQGVLPVPRIRMQAKPRDHYSACGESSTYATSYTNVPVRPMKQLPRMSIPDKEIATSVKAPVYEAQVMAATGARGHPLFWGEMKDVDVYVALYKDLNIHHIFDLTPGSAAAACAAAILGICYEGVAMSQQHAQWLEHIMDKTIFAILADGDATDDKELRTDLMAYLMPLVEEGRTYLLRAENGEDEEEEEADEDEEAA